MCSALLIWQCIQDCRIYRSHICVPKSMDNSPDTDIINPKVHTNPRHWKLSRACWIHSAFIHSTFKICFNIIVSACGFPMLWLPFSFSSKVQHLHLYACLCPMLSTCPLYRPRWLDHGNTASWSSYRLQCCWPY